MGLKGTACRTQERVCLERYNHFFDHTGSKNLNTYENYENHVGIQVYVFTTNIAQHYEKYNKT